MHQINLLKSVLAGVCLLNGSSICTVGARDEMAEHQDQHQVLLEALQNSGSWSDQRQWHNRGEKYSRHMGPGEISWNVITCKRCSFVFQINLWGWAIIVSGVYQGAIIIKRGSANIVYWPSWYCSGWKGRLNLMTATYWLHDAPYIQTILYMLNRRENRTPAGHPQSRSQWNYDQLFINISGCVLLKILLDCNPCGYTRSLVTVGCYK